MNKRLTLSKILNTIGANHIGAQLSRKRVIILNYHRIFEQPLRTEFDTGVFGHSVDEFEEQMRWIKKYCNPITQDQFLNGIESGFPNKINVLITFDDGYIDNYTLAFPILKKLEMSAVFFVPYNAIEKREIGWWDRSAWAINKTSKGFSTFLGNESRLASPQDKHLFTLDVIRHLKSIPLNSIDEYLAKFEEDLEVDAPTFEQQSAQLMTWDQLREMIDHGMYIGSHSVSHKVLARLEKEEQEREITDSKSLIEKRIGSCIDTIAYPVGKQYAFNDYSKLYSKQAGFKAGFSFYPGYYDSSIDDLFDIRRIALSPESSLFKSELVLPSVFTK